jgi:hypothetical protein
MLLGVIRTYAALFPGSHGLAQAFASLAEARAPPAMPALIHMDAKLAHGLIRLGLTFDFARQLTHLLDQLATLNGRVRFDLSEQGVEALSAHE